MDFLAVSALPMVFFALLAERSPACTTSPSRLFDTLGCEPQRSGVALVMTLGSDRLALYGLAALAVIVLWFALAALAWILLPARRGFSPGKWLLGLRVVDDAGGLPGTRRMALRQLTLIADAFPWLLFGLLGAIVAGIDPQRRRLGDRAAGTRVVRLSHP